MLGHHPDGTLTHFGRKFRGFALIRHGSSLSRVGASGKPGAVHALEVGVHIGPGVHAAATIHFGEPCFVGTEESLKRCLEIGTGTVVGAGTVVISQYRSGNDGGRQSGSSPAGLAEHLRRRASFADTLRAVALHSSLKKRNNLIDEIGRAHV